jgi:integrase
VRNLNKETVALTEEQYKEIIYTMRSGFVCADSHIVKPNTRIATALSLEANLGLRISDILQLRLSAIIRDGDRYRLNIVEQKTKKKREFTVPTDIYIYIQNYALENNINPSAKLFDISERAVNKHLKLVCDYLGYSGIGSHSFRKYFATSIYVNNHYDINLVRVLLQHSSAVTTQRYIGLQRQEIENALQNHIKLL